MRNLPTYHNKCCALFSLSLSVLVVVFSASFSANAQVPPKSLSHYLRDEWGNERGFSSGAINVIAQTSDGYLWLGTQKGLVQFDGRDFHLFSQSDSGGRAFGPVLGLLSDSNGNLWVRLAGPRLLRYRDGKFEDLTNSFSIPEVAVTQMCRSADGRAVFATIMNGTLVYDHGNFTAVAPPPPPSDFIVIAMAPDPKGQYFLGTRDRGLFRIRDGQVSAVEDTPQEWKINALLSAEPDQLWIGTDKGLFSWSARKLTHVGLNSPLRDRQILSLSRDAQRSVWVGTDRGMYRLDPADNFVLKEENFADGGPVSAIFEDRESNIWAATSQGLRRFRNTVFTTFPASDGPLAESSGPVYVDADGRTWSAPAKGGLYWFRDGKIGRITAAGLDRDVVYSLAGGNGDLWVARQLGGLTHLRNSQGEWEATTYTKKDGLPQDSIFTVRVARDGTVWAGSLNAGLAQISHGRFTTFTTQNGLPSNSIASILEATDGTMFFATPRGLSSYSNGRWLSFSSRNGLPSDDLNCLFQDSAGVLWIGTANGLAALRSGKIIVPAHAPGILREPIFGLREDHDGFLWISTSNHVLRVNRTRLLDPAFNDSDLRTFDLADGLRNADGMKRDEAVALDAAGQIWFSLSGGLALADAYRLRTASPPTILRVDKLSADGTPLPLQNSLRAPHPQRVTIDYSGVSLAVPDRVTFKYKLDGFDRDWNGPLSTHQAVYTNLSPGSYSFRLMASNSDGIWNGQQLTLSFVVEPVFWRTWWFAALAVLTAILAILLIVRLRLLSLTRQLNLLFEERLSERTRIARELHDTLLQSFQGLVLRFQTASNLLPARPEEAKQKLDSAIELAAQAVTEGRNAVQGLRSSKGDITDLAVAVTTLGKELATNQANQNPALFGVAVEGQARDLHPILRDEVYRIAGEAMRNAFRHAQAKRIEVEIHYDASHLRLRIRDNGKGMESDVAEGDGRAGHFGLPGMRERAQEIGGKLEVWSSAQSGTEVELTVPASAAYAAAKLSGGT